MSSEKQRYRLITRSDFDGLVCAMLLKQQGILDDVKFVHPKDVQDGKVEVSPTDILTNLPYVEGCHLCFDHHASEEVRHGGASYENRILEPDADSAARVVYNYYGGEKTFPEFSQEMLEAVDQADSARFNQDEILNPQGWTLLSFIMDPRTGLGRFRNFRVSNYQLMMDLIDYCMDHTVDEVMELPDVKERVELYRAHTEKFEEQLRRCGRVVDNVIVLDLRNEETIWCGNRFMIYAVYPDCSVSIHVLWGLKKQNTVLAMGKSILKRTNETDIGSLGLSYGGGGHPAAGTCQVPNDQADTVLNEVVDKINTGEPSPPA